MIRKTIFTLFLTVNYLSYVHGYSALEDARIIAEYKKQLKELNHPKIARQLVHQATWASMGTISTNDLILGYPMVNIISIDDSDLNGKSTGRIRFLLTDLDFSGPDYKQNNKVTILLSDEQNLNCRSKGMDPMEPTCARTIISGQIEPLAVDKPEYRDALAAFQKRHPAAVNWMKAHSFYLCELNIQNIFVLDFYGGPHNVSPDDYYKTNP